MDRVTTVPRQTSPIGDKRPSSSPLSSAPSSTAPAQSPSLDILETESALAAMVRQEHEWIAKFPEHIRPDIKFLLDHQSGQNLKTHHCMGVAHTDTFKTADHTRVTPHTLLAAEIALEMAEQLKLDPCDTRDLVAAVAGHDQGHIFASHESEIAINSFPEFDGTPGRAHYCHERRTKELFDSDDFVRHFGRDRVDTIQSILYEPHNPLHILVDWSDRLAYLIADSVHLGHQDIIESSHVRQDFIQSLVVLPDGSIGFASLEAVQSLINARNLLYQRVSIGHASALFTGFLTEAYHRAVALHKTTPTEFVRLISERTTPEARKLFAPKDIPRLYCPQQEPGKAKPVDLDYQPICHITLDMLSEKGRQWALTDPPVSPHATVPACSQQRAGMSKLEHHIRNFFAKDGGTGYLDRSGAVVGISHIPRKFYSLRTVDDAGKVCAVEQCGIEQWEFFLALPKEMGSVRAILHREACQALLRAELINPAAASRLLSLPSADFFTRY